MSERRMQAVGVAGAFNEVWQVGCDVLEGFAVADADALDFQGLQEAFGLGIVSGVAAPAHGADEAPFLQDAPVPERRVPDATIGVADATGQRPPVFDGERERSRQKRGDSPDPRALSQPSTLNPRASPQMPPKWSLSCRKHLGDVESSAEPIDTHFDFRVIPPGKGLHPGSNFRRVQRHDRSGERVCRRSPLVFTFAAPPGAT